MLQFTKKPGLGRKPNEKLAPRVIWTIVIAVLAFLMTIPFFWMLSASMKYETDVMKLPIEWIPKYFNIDNYKEVWNIGGAAKKDYHFALAYFNSIKIAIINVTGAVLTSALAGYAFAKLKFRGRNVVFLLYLSTMMIPSQITIIPKFVVFKQLGLIGTHWTLILPGIFTITGTFLMRQYFMQVPDELRESGRIDGASELRIWWQIMLPIAKASLAALGMMVFLWTWNNYLDALVFLPNWKLYTIPLALTNFIEESSTQYALMMAAAASALVPVFIVFIAGQKFFVKGLTAGAVKG
ncbi:MAG: carbohydrate ABC transporter permease [Faecalibacterium sp.]|jgi:multiple sugar transport system permease protein|nr:carbohydrate ABC transporter permease [Faecalibacterium sp.]